MFGTWGKPAATTTQSSVFGSPASSSMFSFNNAKKPATGFLAPSQQTTSSSLFSMSLPKPATPNLFGSLTTPAGQQQPFSFNAASKPSSIFIGAFSNPATTSQSSLFSFNSLQSSQPASSQLGASFWPQSQQQQQQQQLLQQQQQKQNSVDAFYASLSQPLLFGDERDNIIARLNQLQAMIGTGTGYSALGTVTYTPDNAFSRFRGITYNVLPTSSESDGLVCLELNRPCSDVQSQKQGLQDHLFGILGGHINFQLSIEEIRPAARSEASSTEVVVKVIERQTSGTTHTIPASDLATFLCSAAIQTQLASQLCVTRVTPELAPTPSELKTYLETPPAGLDRLIWQQARADNPVPDRLIPVPVIGFTDLKRRHADQKVFEEQQGRSVKHLLTVASGLRTRQLSITQKISQLKRKQIELNHRVLKILAKQIVTRRTGFAISADEEALRGALERIWTEITSPRGLRARIQQLVPTLRTSLDAKFSNSASPIFDQGASTPDVSGGPNSTWWQQTDVVDDLKEYLSQRNEGIKEMRRLLTKLTNTVRCLAEKKAQLSSGTGFYPVDSSKKLPAAFGLKLGSI